MLLESLLTSWLVAASLMCLMWFYYLYCDDPAVVDIGWSLSIASASSWLAYSLPSSGLRPWLLCFCILIWSIRLIALLITRLKKGQKDQRYEALSAYWQQGLRWKYFLFFQAQAVTVALLLTPIIFAFLAKKPMWTIWDLLGFSLYLFSFTGEVIADWQMTNFRLNAKNTGKVCSVGLWRYSRHPNYFFEFLVWVSYAIIGLNHIWGIIGFVSPAVILIALLNITGIPPTERRLLASKGDAYREYQKSTSAFFPLPPRK